MNGLSWYCPIIQITGTPELYFAIKGLRCFADKRLCQVMFLVKANSPTVLFRDDLSANAIIHVNKSAIYNWNNKTQT